MIKILVSKVPDVIPDGVTYEEYKPTMAWAENVKGYLRISHVGLVLWTGEHNHYDDSDFYAVVWDSEAGQPRELEYATTRGWTYANSAVIDATPDVLAAYESYRADLAASQQRARDAQEAATPRAGKTVRVVKGRKIAKGTVAQVVWYGPGRIYGGSARRQGTPPMRVGLKINGERVFTDAANVQVITE